MGICASKSENLSPEERLQRSLEAKRSKELDAVMNNAHGADLQVNKLLLLGAGECGKSTLFKQMITIYGKGFPEEERKAFTAIIYSNIIGSIKVLAEHCPTFGPVEGADAKVAYRTVMEDLEGDEEIDMKLANTIKTLWLDPGTQKTYEKRSQYQLTDSAKYFFDQLDNVAKKDWIPSEQDVLRSRVRTTGIVENTFIIDGNNFKMFDVGGQRNERKKWIHCFENVTAVLFVAAISAYDQVLYEDENTNRMVEALNLFTEICNSNWFRETAMILFLNKRDLFEEKIKKVPLTVCFPDYAGTPGDYHEGCEYITERFVEKNKNVDKTVYHHVTCATDTNNVATVFNIVKDIIIRRSLNEAGLV